MRYGWEKKQFYKDWSYGDEDNPFAQNFPGVFVDFMMDTIYSDIWLDIFKKILHDDKDYVKRIEQHYKMFRKKVECGKYTKKSSENYSEEDR